MRRWGASETPSRTFKPMTLRAVIVIIALFAAFCPKAQARDGQDKNPVRLGAIVTFSDYSEANNMDEKGFLYGVTASYARQYGGFYLAIDGAGLMGLKKYSNTQYSTDAVRDTFFELRGLTGGLIASYPASSFALYGGLGFRRLYDELSRLSILNVAGYDRRTTYYYLPVGLAYKRELIGAYTLEANAEIDAIVYGEQRNYNLPNNWPPSINRMGAGHGVRATVLMTNSGDNTDISFGARYVFWKAYASDTVNGIVEPQNETTEISIIAAIGF